LSPIEPNEFPELDREMQRRDDHGIIVPDVQMQPHGNSLAALQQGVELRPDGADIVVNFAGFQSTSSPPDDTGDVGPVYYVQGDNSANSIVTIYDKSGSQQAQFYMEDLAPGAPCNNGYCDPIIQYDQMADRWLISEFDGSGADDLCVYVSQTSDPTGAWYAYAFNPVNSGMQDYPKYGVWSDGYYIGVNNGGWVIALERAAMLAGDPASMQEFNIGTLPGWGFQLTLPATVDGASPAPPAGEPAIFMRPRDTEVHGGSCPSCDLMEMWELDVDWVTPANSTLTQIASVQMTDWDHTLCGTSGNWDCMPQPGTGQQIDPIREPLHYPLQYRNFGTHETLVGCFAEDVDGTDRAAVHWFEIRRTPPGGGGWALQQEGVISSADNVHRSVCSAAMDGGGNILVGYTRTGPNAPYYPSIYYAGRLATDPLGTMPIFDQMIWDATTSKTNNERWGDYAGIGVDPADDCTIWFTTEYGGSGHTRIAGIHFEPIEAAPETLSVCQPDDAVYDVEVVKACFKSSVDLSTSGLPGGTTESWSANPVTPHGSSVLTIGNTGAAAAGTYSIDIIGTEGATVFQDTVTLKLADAPPGQTTLLTPADGTTDVSPTPTFDWDDVAGAATYEIEIATDPDFGTIVDSAAGLTSSHYTPGAALAADTVHYWRVRSFNACGTSSDSTIWAFRTEATTCTTYGPGETGTIRDANVFNPRTTTFDLTVPDSCSIVDLNMIDLRGTHAYIGDLEFNLRSPIDTNVQLWNQMCGSADDFDKDLNDEAANPVACPLNDNTSQQPAQALSAYDGENSNGTWTLRVTDHVRGYSGTLQDWNLEICCGGASAQADYSDLSGSYGVAWHTGDGTLRLGTAWDADTSFANGDDDASDDGVTLEPTTGWQEGALVTIYVEVTGADGNDYLAGWFDWNDDGDFADAQEKAVTLNDPVEGSNTIHFTIPSGVGYDTPGRVVNARFRLYEVEPTVQGTETPLDGASDGEVEDSTFDPPEPTAVRLVAFEAFPAAGGGLVTWETESEMNNLGFNLYRSTASEVLGERLNETLIPSKVPGGGGGANYTFLDETALPGATHYYTLEDVDFNGVRTLHGPATLILWQAFLPLVLK
jgi:subtilisin-like proprotein convertase family protein